MTGLYDSVAYPLILISHSRIQAKLQLLIMAAEFAIQYNSKIINALISIILNPTAIPSKELDECLGIWAQASLSLSPNDVNSRKHTQWESNLTQWMLPLKSKRFWRS
jgi:hypothetical protein